MARPGRRWGGEGTSGASLPQWDRPHPSAECAVSSRRSRVGAGSESRVRPSRDRPSRSPPSLAALVRIDAGGEREAGPQDDLREARHAVLAVHRALAGERERGELHLGGSRDGLEREEETGLDGGQDKMLRAPRVARAAELDGRGRSQERPTIEGERGRRRVELRSDAAEASNGVSLSARRRCGVPGMPSRAAGYSSSKYSRSARSTSM
jgi:hypothetical protein